MKFKVKERKEEKKNNKNKIENIVFLLVVLIFTIIIINVLLKDKSTNNLEKDSKPDKVLAEMKNDNGVSEDVTLKDNLEKILSTIKGVGDVKVFVNYSETNKTIAMYDETTTTSSTEETDSAGGTRDTTSTETQKQVVYSDDDGNKMPVTQKIIMPTIEGAIITAKGASNTDVKKKIINAVEAATGLSIDKIQVFEME